MAFKVLLFVCFAVPSVVTSSVVRGHHDKSSRSQNHVVEALTFPLLKRQDLPARNGTTTTASIVETHIQPISSITYVSTKDQVGTISDSLKDSLSAMTTTSRLVQSSSYSAAIQQSELASQPDLATPTITQLPLNSAHETYSSRLGSSSSSPSLSQHYVFSQAVNLTITSTIPPAQVSAKESPAPDSGILSIQSTQISPGPSTRTAPQASPPQITDHSFMLYVLSNTTAEIQSRTITSDLSSRIESHGNLPAASPTSPQVVSIAESLPFSSTTRLEPGTLQHNTEIKIISQSSRATRGWQAVSASGLISNTSSAPSTNDFTTGSSLGVTIASSGTFPAATPSSTAISTQEGSSEIQYPFSIGPITTSTTVLPSSATGGVTFPNPVVSSSVVLKSSALNGSIPTPESIGDVPHVTQSSSTLILHPTTQSGVSYLGISGTRALITPSSNIMAYPAISTTSLLWTMSVVNVTSVTVSSSSYPGSMPTTNVSIVPELGATGTSSHPAMVTTSKSLLGENSQLSAGTTLITNSTAIFGTIMPLSTVRTISAIHEGWNTTTSLGAALPETSVNSGKRPSGFVINSSKIDLHTPQTPFLPVWANSTAFANVPTAAASVGSTDLINEFAVRTSQVSIARYSTSSERKWATQTVNVAFSPTSTATNSETLSPPVAPPLTSSQTVGVAVASTTGILIAVVAAIFLARRSRVKRSRRSSTGSVYPKVAYLYDPSGRGPGRAADPEEPLMSGGASGMPVINHNTLERPVPFGSGHGHSAGTLPLRFTGPNSFRYPDDTLRCSNHFNGRSTCTSAGAVAAVSAAMRGYNVSPEGARTRTEGSLAAHTDWTSPTPGPGVTGHAKSPSRRSILSEITSMAYSPMSRSESGASRRQSPSPHELCANRSLPCVKETPDTDSYRDPFEHELLLQVDTRTETPECVTLYAPSTAPTKLLSNNPWAASMVDAQVQPMNNTPRPVSQDTAVVGSAPFSPARSSHATTTYISALQKQEHGVVSPISPPLGTTHRGWDDIRRYSDEKVVPCVPSSRPPQRRLGSFADVKQRALPHLRRREYSLEASSSRIRLPLTLQIPGSTGTVPAADTDGARSPESAVAQSVHSLASLLQKNRSRNREIFART